MNFYGAGEKGTFKVRMASHALRQGELVAYPTEAVYGLGCDPLNKAAVLHLLEIKQRPISKGLILLASDFSQLRPFVEVSTAILNRIMPSWPGPVTWVVPVQSWVPDYLTGKHQSLAIRVSAHPLVSRLCATYGGAIVSTSANVSRQEPARTVLAVRKNFSAEKLFILPGATAQHEKPTAIYHAQTGQCLRL